MKLEKGIRAPSDIGPAILLLRKQNKLTQNALAEITGVKQQTISAIERGNQAAELKTVFAILSALNLELVVRAREQHAQGYAPGRRS